MDEFARVTVVAGARRLDLALPALVPVAELVPELARTMGPPPDRLTGGLGLALLDGARLLPSGTLAGQDVRDGAVLILTGIETPAPRIHDDVCEAMAEAVAEFEPWTQGRGASVAVGLALLGTAALGVPASPSLGWLGGGVAVTVSVLLDRTGRPRSAAAAAWLAMAYVAVATAMLSPSSVLGAAVFVSGAAASGVGAICLAALSGGRWLVAPPVAVAVLASVLGATLIVLPGAGAVVLTAVLAGGVLLTTGAPSLALSLTGARAEQPGRPPRRVDPGLVRHQATRAHRILVSIVATTGLLSTLLAPAAVSLGASGAAVAALAALLQVLRTAGVRSRAVVGAGVVGGGAALASTAVAALWLQPPWRPAVTGVLLVVGALTVVGGLGRWGASSRLRRWVDVVETGSLVALPVLVVLAAGATPALDGLPW